MMKLCNNNWLKFILFSTILHSCSNGETVGDLRAISEILEKYDAPTALDQTRTILVIPARGCDSCIKESVEFVKANSQLPETLFILTGLSTRETELILGKDALQKPNVIVDDNGLAYQLRLVDVQPKVIFLENGLITEVVKLSAPNSQGVLQRISEKID